MSAIGPKQTSASALHMSAFGGSVDTRPGFSWSCRCGAMVSVKFGPPSEAKNPASAG